MIVRLTMRKLKCMLIYYFVSIKSVVVPQRVESRRPFLEYIANGISFLYESTFVFKAGKQHTLELTINSNPDQINIDISGKIENW